MNFVLAFGETTPVNGRTLQAAVCSDVRHLRYVDIILVAANFMIMYKITN